jgi:uncharacterized protein YkwD
MTAFLVASGVMIATLTSAPSAPRSVALERAQPIAAHTHGMHSSRAIENALLAKMNTERRHRHLRLLRRGPLLARYADHWARVLLAFRAFQHQDLGRIVVASGYRLAEVGENLFSGSGRGADDAGTAHITLMRSRTHRENILLPQAQAVGIGAVCLGNKLMVVEDFGIAAGAPLPPAGQRILPTQPLVAKNLGGPAC